MTIIEQSDRKQQDWQRLYLLLSGFLRAVSGTALPPLDVERLHAARCFVSVHSPQVHLPDCDCPSIAAEYARLAAPGEAEHDG